MEIRPLDRETWPALAELFAAGGDPKWCWCQWWRKRNANWTNTTAEDNRADLERLATADPAPGLVALREGRAIGWVGLGPREDFDRLARCAHHPPAPRRGGVDRQLLRRRTRRPAERRRPRAAAGRASPMPASTAPVSSRATPCGTGGDKMTSAGLHTAPSGCSRARGSRSRPRRRPVRRPARHAWSCAASRGPCQGGPTDRTMTSPRRWTTGRALRMTARVRAVSWSARSLTKSATSPLV